MFIVQYWITILWCHAQKRWGKVLKEKNLREQERELRETLKKFLSEKETLNRWINPEKRLDANIALLKPDLPKPIPVVGEEPDRQPQPNLESEGGH